MDFVAVPFSYDYLRQPDYTSMAVQGVLRTEAAGLVLEFRERAVIATGKAADESIRRLQVPWSEVQDAALHEPWLMRPRLVLRTRSLMALDGLPNVRGTEARLKVARADRALAHEAVLSIREAIIDARLASMDASPPPTLPPA